MMQLLLSKRVSETRGSYAPEQKRRFSNRAQGHNGQPVFKTAGARSLVSILIALFFSVSAYASHYKGGQITYESLGGGTYKVTVKSYWRSQLPGSVVPSYSGSPTLNTNLNMVSLTPLPDGVTVEKVEQQTVTWPTPGLYTISWTSCCRVNGGANFGQTDMGLFAAVNYDPAKPSSSPQFYDLPVFNYAANVPLSFGFNNTDPENHDQQYTLNTPYGIATNPYGSMISTGFSISNSGIVSWTNPQQGIWLVNVKLEEKINGVLTGAYVYRDFMLNIVPTTNHAPVLGNLNAQTVREGQNLQFAVNATEPDGNQATLRASGLPMSMGAAFAQTTTGNAPNGTFTWTPPAGSAGTYSVQFVATDNVNPPLSAQQTVMVTVLPLCNLTATAAVTNVPCGNVNTGAITVTATGSANYEYSKDGGITFQNANVFSNLAPGTYEVVVKDGVCSSQMQTVTIIANPLPVVTLDNFASLCGNSGNVTLTGGQPLGGTYSGTGVSNGIFNPAVAGFGAHTITYTYTNSNGCVNAATATITVGAGFTANAGPDKTVVTNYNPTKCVTLTGSASNANGTYTYLWSNGATTPSINVCPTTTTTYTLTITNAAGCTATDQVTVKAIDASCGNRNEKVTICHNGHEICVSVNAVQAHLAHGDVLGNCQSSNNQPAKPNNGGGTINNKVVSDILMTAVPNPFTENTQIDFVMPETGSYALAIYDLKGMLVKNVEEGNATANERRSIEVNGNQWPKGVYMARLVTGKEVKVIKIVLAK
ncbi:T9SS type A sorting domain-containing protein [Adhaeribacter sp. BT258]|uniref:T9SS type A sorting domain-containing protein n=1 Tax=Adhaeribacter terrigena TaxID=2793070 RepID=A0ABS1C213_9BACT|nr:Ig-like domain-containing protein [Adhaeribacter terrigena]MBK0403437.1 T9SS type A sorting domain-containing protein [Adhaeribacter terrigena]